MKVVPLIPRDHAAFLQDLQAHDEANAWQLVSLYPTMIDALEPDQLKPLAAKMAMLLAAFAITAGRHDCNTSGLIEHITLDLLPLPAARLILHTQM